MTKLEHIHGILFDLEGVFYVGNQLIEGGADAVRVLHQQGIPCRYVTNTTTKSTRTLHRKLVGLGLPIEENEIISAPYATVLHLRQMNNPRCYLLLNDDTKQDFSEFTQTDDEPDVVVIGDIGDAWDYDLVNRIFRMVMDGAQLIALHKGKFWQTDAGLQVDIGAFVAGLEYVTDQEAVVVGKPSSFFFEMAIQDMALPPDQVAMVGDDIDSDIGGAQAAGLTGILVKTGKYREAIIARSAVKPDLGLDSVADLPGYL